MSFAEPGLEIVPGLTLLRLLGRGGMGEAWLARDDERGEEVAAKVLPPDAPAEHLALLRREARLGRRLSHPRIVPVYDLRSGPRGSAITLRYMRGGAAVWRGGVPPRDAVRLGRDVAEALEYLHGEGIVHRDVKASNVLLDEEGRAHLADFGIAAVSSGEEEGMVLRGGGSPASMSPQQRAGAPATPSDDLYSLGAFLSALLSGGAPVPSFPLPDSLASLVASLLAKSPSERPASARIVRETLEAIASQLEGTPSPAERAPARDIPPPLRLQPPPRVAEGGPVAPTGVGAPRPQSREGLSFAQMNLLAGLFVAAVVTVVWLPGWVTPPTATSPSVSSPTPVPSETLKPTPLPVTAATPVETPPPASPDPPADPRVVHAPSAPTVSSTPPPEEPSMPMPTVAPTPDRTAEARELARHRGEARVFEEKEEWTAALREYEAALALDPFVTFAIEGRERTGIRAALQTAMAFHLRNPARLSTEAVAREAETLLERARGIDSPGPRQIAQIAALERALADARSTVAVQIESDGQTDLVVSNVGRLGTLTHKTMQLRPGRYTVVGSRRGYRDVRREFTIAPGSAAQTVVVRCEEVI